MEYMFTPVRGKFQKSCEVHSTSNWASDAPTSRNQTPSRRQNEARCRCELLKRLNFDLYSDVPVYSSPRLELVRKRLFSNKCKAALRQGEATRVQKKDVILRVKRTAMKEKDRLLSQKYADLSKKMAAILSSPSPDSPIRRVLRKKSVIVTAV